jgi:hypothetical protein
VIANQRGVRVGNDELDNLARPQFHTSAVRLPRSDGGGTVFLIASGSFGKALANHLFFRRHAAVPKPLLEALVNLPRLVEKY